LLSNFCALSTRLNYDLIVGVKSGDPRLMGCHLAVEVQTTKGHPRNGDLSIAERTETTRSEGCKTSSAFGLASMGDFAGDGPCDDLVSRNYSTGEDGLS
jgi:hypothetical protein